MSNMTRDELVGAIVDPWRLRYARREVAAFAEFCQRLQLAKTVDSVALYLTWLVDSQALSGPRLRRRLNALDLATRVSGDEPWSSQPVLRDYLRGLHAEVALERSGPVGDPLYRELLQATVDATMLPERRTLEATLVAILVTQASLTLTIISALKWRHFRHIRGGIEVDISQLRRPWSRLPPLRQDHG